MAQSIVVELKVSRSTLRGTTRLIDHCQGSKMDRQTDGTKGEREGREKEKKKAET